MTGSIDIKQAAITQPSPPLNETLMSNQADTARGLHTEQAITNYLDIALSLGVNLQPGQELIISTEKVHSELALRLAAIAYQRGAKHVSIDYDDPALTRAKVENSAPGHLSYVPSWVRNKIDHIVDTGTARIVLDGEEDPHMLEGLNPGALSTVSKAWGAAKKRYYDEGINESKVRYAILAVPTEKWAMQIFPDLPPDKARQSLWHEILKACRADTDDWLARWQEHDKKLHDRCDMLNTLQIESLHFTGPGTDLTVRLSPSAIFQGGSEKSDKGVPFIANIPTEEVYTTPDWRGTEGTVKLTKPFMLKGTLIEGLELVFKGGEIKEFRAAKGEEVFAEHIRTDPGACRLGEVALVGTDSPIYQSGLFFRNTLFDENAACHIAIGSAYLTCISNGSQMTEAEKDSLGINDSLVHDDMMISSEEVTVTAKTRGGQEVTLIERGAWKA